MDNENILMVAALGISAALIFGGGILLSKAIRADKIQEKDKKKDNKSALLVVAAVMIAAGLIFGGGVLISHAVRTDNIQESEPKLSEEPITNATEYTLIDDTTITEVTEITKTTVTESTTIEITTEITTNTEQIDEETETEIVQQEVSSELLPLNEINIDDKGSEDGFGCLYANDGSIIVDCIVGESMQYGASEVTLPEYINGYRVRAIDICYMQYNYDDYCYQWSSVSTLYVPTSISFYDEEWTHGDVSWHYVEVSKEDAVSCFAENGITLFFY